MKRRSKSRFVRGNCPNPDCGAVLVASSNESGPLQCSACDISFERIALKNPQNIISPIEGIITLLSTVLEKQSRARDDDVTEKVDGVSNFECKLLSPLLTTHGMDKAGRPRLLSELKEDGKATFDCAALGDRAFLIDPSLASHPYFGRDRSGSIDYLAEVLAAVRAANGNDDAKTLVPIHVDGDGHCLVHALSRCLVGRELFWHALRTNMHEHLTTHLPRYKSMLSAFVADAEWDKIIAEAHPDYTPPDDETKGLGNVHIFALANVLRRPIVLLDTPEVMKSSNGYSGVFLPKLYTPNECRRRDGDDLNAPIVIAWSSMSHHHFVPLVATTTTTRFPRRYMPDVWGGFAQEILDDYVAFDAPNDDGCCRVGVGKTLTSSYLTKLIEAMRDRFRRRHDVASRLVADVKEQVHKRRGFIQLELDYAIQSTKAAVDEGRLYRCIVCRQLAESVEPSDELLLPGGSLYETARARFGRMIDGQEYVFPFHGIKARYNGSGDVLEFVASEANCPRCSIDEQIMRPVRGDGSIVYENGDRLEKPAAGRNCCGFKHYWDGKEYDNIPQKIPIAMEWGGVRKEDEVYWFENESDPSLNSNVYAMASELVNRNFPGEFGVERLVPQVVNIILKSSRKMKKKEAEEEKLVDTTSASKREENSRDSSIIASSATSSPSKIILTGEKQKTIHKEELTMSSKEKEVKRRIAERAGVQQRTKTGPLAKKPAKQKESPPLRTPSKPAAKSSSSTAKTVRVSLSDGRAGKMTFPECVSYAQLKNSISAEFGVASERQKIRHGFPPKELCPPNGDVDDVVPLQHGDKLSVEILKPAEDSLLEDVDLRRFASGQTLSSSSQQDDGDEQLRIVLANLISRIQELDDVENWETKPELFEPNGYYFELVKKQLPQRHGLHCHLTGIAEKVFALNLKANPPRLELCDSQWHRVVGALHADDRTIPCNEGVDGEGSSRSFSAAFRRDSVEASNVRAFSGTGYSLAGGGSTSQVSSNKEIQQVEARIKDLEEKKDRLDKQMERMDQDDEIEDDDDDVDARFYKLNKEKSGVDSELKRLLVTLSDLKK